ncbi:hypothetical protein [Mariniblastus fucicola]|uniref:DUF4830 domain-containing protein n=1 Tax=Mariniblastus fucicola TaxID=980251 RepID=A0A5B9PBV9_9BACT|nr:hypothetical protein [Mariniblastus fucicola]QEG21986.1 hypothetical protein MFFC18_18470 [Mariniblastus fucicola]
MKISILNLLLAVVIVALSFAILTQRKKPLDISTGDSFSWSIRQEALKASPTWSATEENPPLSVRKALGIADEIASNMNTETKQFDVGKWTFDSLDLVPLDNNLYSENRSKWCYLVPFQGVRLSGHSGPPYVMSMLILMDGRVIVGETHYDANLGDAIKRIYPDPTE